MANIIVKYVENFIKIMVNDNHITDRSIDAGINTQHLEAQVWESLYAQNPHKIFCGYCEQEIGGA